MAGRKSSRCPECGAREGTCFARFEEFLAKEFQDPAYGSVHHLTVSAYLLQHSSQLTSEGWLHERQLLRDFLLKGLAPDQVRRQNADYLDSGLRTFKIKSRDGGPLFPRVKWSKTILDVSSRSANQYCDDVRAWATATLLDSEKIAVQLAGGDQRTPMA